LGGCGTKEQKMEENEKDFLQQDFQSVTQDFRKTYALDCGAFAQGEKKYLFPGLVKLYFWVCMMNTIRRL
jgi:hypothetical protein